jgi:energy-coupling factor transporter transmembrane protein EcfT
VVLVASPLAWITTIAVLAAAFAGVEAIARRRLLSFLASMLLLAGTIALIVGFTLLPEALANRDLAARRSSRGGAAAREPPKSTPPLTRATVQGGDAETGSRRLGGRVVP